MLSPVSDAECMCALFACECAARRIQRWWQATRSYAIVADTETTDFTGDVIALAFVVLKGDIATETYYELWDTEKEIAPGAQQIHGITRERLNFSARAPTVELTRFFETVDRVVARCGKVVFHNAAFDVAAINRTAKTFGVARQLDLADTLCTMRLATAHTQLPRALRAKGGKKSLKVSYKPPKNVELFACLFPEEDMPAENTLHDALVDTQITTRNFIEGRRRGWW